MKRVNSHTLGLAVGGFLAVYHLIWAGLVYFGAAQQVLDYVFRLHMIAQPFTVAQFTLANAGQLVLLTGFIGYASGWLVGAIINACAPRFDARSIGHQTKAA